VGRLPARHLVLGSGRCVAYTHIYPYIFLSLYIDIYIDDVYDASRAISFLWVDYQRDIWYWEVVGARPIPIPIYLPFYIDIDV